MQLQEVSKEVWRDNYKAPKERKLQDTWERQARAASSVEDPSKKQQIYEDFLWLLTDFHGIAGGRITANLGVEGREATTLFNCFVHHPADIGYKDVDSIHGIYDMLKAQALTLKSEGGYGMNFSWIRPAGMYVSGIGARTPGVLAFMELWEISSKTITRGSEKIIDYIREGEKKKIRKGAQMGILEIWHPEIEDFIEVKLTKGRLEKFNLSVGITNGFMDAVINDEMWELVFPDTKHEKYETEWNGNLDDWKSKKLPVTVYHKVKARALWDKIMHSTYTRNEPGVIFLDLMNKLNPFAYGEHIVTTNPCAEIGMSTGVCNLMSLNLVKFTIKGDDGKYYFDYDSFKRAITIAVRFSDNINDISRVPLEEYRVSMIEKRRIGIGTLGIGSLHYMLGIKFGSDESLKLIEGIYCAKAETELLASAKLGKEKGSFVKFDKKKYFSSYWWQNLPINKDIKKEIEDIGEMRNSHQSANAPTGNMSVYVGCVSSGIEPVFLHEYVRWVIVNDQEKSRLRESGFKFPDISKQEWFESEHMKVIKINNEEILEGKFEDVIYRVDKNRGLIKQNVVEDYGWRFAKQNFSEEHFKELNDKGVFITTDELSVDDHINTLEVVAKYTNMSTSKTINIPNDYTFESFKHIYMKAWESGIKGVTSYRAGTMAGVLEKKQDISDKLESLEHTFIDAGDKVIFDKVKLPEVYYSMGYIIRDNNHKKWYVNIAFADKSLMRPFALFVSTNNKESNEVTDDTIHSIFKLAHEKGISKKSIDLQLEKYHGQSNVTKIARTIGFVLHHNIPVIDVVDNLISCDFPFSSFSFHITRLLKKFIKDGTKVSGNAAICPECKSKSMIFQDGCIICKDCNWSKCG